MQDIEMLPIYKSSKSKGMLLSKNLGLIFILVVGIFPNFAIAQGHESFKIIGNVAGLQEGEKVLLAMDTSVNEGPPAIIDSCVAKMGRFSFLGNIPEGPRMMRLFFGNHQQIRDRYFLLDNQKGIVYIQGEINNEQNINLSISVDGSLAENDYLKVTSVFNTSISLLENLLKFHHAGTKKGLVSYMATMSNSIGYNKQLMNVLEDIRDSIMTVTKNMIMNELSDNNQAIPFLLYANWNELYLGHDAFFQQVYKLFDFKTKNSFYGKMLSRELSVGILEYAPDFTETTIDGQQLSLKEVLKNSKLTMLDFWSSGCFACIAECNATIVPLYQLYHNKGFNIVGISYDQYKEPWKIAIDEYNLKWYNVSSLKGFDNDPVYKLYGIFNLPNNVLIDGQGKIIAWNVFGLELQWYLNKYLDEPAKTDEATKVTLK